jgi:hypothetical protein
LLNKAKAVQSLRGVIRRFLLGKCLNEKSNNQTQSFKGLTDTLDPQAVPSMSSTPTWNSTNPPTTLLDLPNLYRNEEASLESNMEHNLLNSSRPLPVSVTGYGHRSNNIANHGHASEETLSTLPDQGMQQADGALASFGQSKAAQETVLSAGIDNLGNIHWT